MSSPVFDVKAALLFVLQHLNDLGAALHELDYYVESRNNEELEELIAYAKDVLYPELDDQARRIINSINTSMDRINEIVGE
jgi:hypothetical protein